MNQSNKPANKQKTIHFLELNNIQYEGDYKPDEAFPDGGLWFTDMNTKSSGLVPGDSTPGDILDIIDNNRKEWRKFKK